MAAGTGITIEQDPDGDWLETRGGGFDAVLMDQQIATARKYPRGSVGRIAEDIAAMVTYSEEAAEECVYAVPRGGKSITGPSVRFAEAVASCWGNSEHGAKIVGVDDQFVTAQAAYRDLERNIRVVIEVKRPIVDSQGNRYKADMIGVTSNAAMSIALRNAILKGVPKAAWGPAFAKAFAMISGTFESLEKRRTAALDAFKKLGVEQDLVLQIVNAKKVSDIQPEDMIVLRGTLQAIKDGDTTVRAVFGNSTNRTAAQKADVGGHLDKGKANGKAAETQPSPAQGGGTGGEGGGASNGNAGRSDETGRGGSAAGRSAPAGGDADPGAGPADGQDAAAAGTSTAADAPPDGGGPGAGDEGGSGGGASADASGASEDASALPIDESYLPYLKAPEAAAEAFTDSEVTKLTNFARALSGATTSVKVAGVIAEFQPIFESAGADVTSAFQKMGALANKAARKGARSKL